MGAAFNDCIQHHFRYDQFFGCALTMLRSSYYALGYAANDMVLIILWSLAAAQDPVYLPVVINFFIFFLNDMYGFISWKKREHKKRRTNLC